MYFSLYICFCDPLECSQAQRHVRLPYFHASAKKYEVPFAGSSFSRIYWECPSWSPLELHYDCFSADITPPQTVVGRVSSQVDHLTGPPNSCHWRLCGLSRLLTEQSLAWVKAALRSWMCIACGIAKCRLVLELQSCGAGARWKTGQTQNIGKKGENWPRSKVGKKWPKNTKKMENRAKFPFFRIFSAFFPHSRPAPSFSAIFSHSFPIFGVRPVSIVCQPRTVVILELFWFNRIMSHRACACSDAR